MHTMYNVYNSLINIPAVILHSKITRDITDIFLINMEHLKYNLKVHFSQIWL